jgi:cell shape-determining protein MreD
LKTLNHHQHPKGKEMKKREFITLILFHAFLLIIVYVFQGMIFPFMRLNGLVPLLLPIASTGVALYEGRNTGGIVGLFAGILCDVSFNQPAGVFTVLLTLTGLFIGALADTVILRGFVTYYFSCAAVLIVSAFVQMFPLIIDPYRIIPMQSLITIAIQQTIYSLILALPIWFFVRSFGKRADRMSSSGRAY